MPVTQGGMLHFRDVTYAVFATLFICALGLYIPFLGLLLSFVWAVPIGLLTVKSGLKFGILGVILVILALAFLVGPALGVVTGIQLGSLGLVLGYMFKKGRPPGHILVTAFIVTVLITGIIFFLPLLASYNKGAIEEEFSAQMDELLSGWQKAGVFEKSGINRETVEESMDSALEWFVRVLPSMTVITAMISAFSNFLLLHRFLGKRGVSISPLPPFGQWRIPWFTPWGVILGLGLALLGDYLNIGRLFFVGQNIVFCFIPLVLVIGTSVAVNLFSRVKLQFLKMIIIFTSFLYLPVTVGIMILIGVFDPLVDFRRIQFNKE